MLHLSPLDPELILVVSAASLGACSMGRFEDLLRHFDDFIAINSEIPNAYRQRVVAIETLIGMVPGMTLMPHRRGGLVCPGLV